MSDLESDVEQHESVWLLLPWYVNGTLEAAERGLVEDHLAACSGCVEELARCKGLAAALRGRQESAPSPHPIQLARLMERVEASERGFEALAEIEDAGSSTPRRDRRDQPERPASRLLGSTPRPVRWALAGQLAALILLAAALAFGPARRFQAGATAPAAPQKPRDAEYVTLSAPAGNAGSAVAAARPQIRLMFVESATEKQLRDVLLRTSGRLVDGPNLVGAYTLELPAPPSAAAAQPDLAVGTILAYLRSQPIVRFAEPVAGTTAQSQSPAGSVAAPLGQRSAQGSLGPPRP